MALLRKISIFESCRNYRIIRLCISRLDLSFNKIFRVSLINSFSLKYFEKKLIRNGRLHPKV